MPNSKRKQEVIKVDLDGRSPEELAEIRKQLKAVMEKVSIRLSDYCLIPHEVAFPDVKTAVLTPEDLDSGALWYFWRMLTYYNDELWWGYAGWEAFGWWEGENPFKGWWNGEGKYWYDADIAYVKSLDYKGKEKTYSEPQGERAFFIVSSLEKAFDALKKIANKFALSYEDGVVKILAWNDKNPDVRACLMVKYDWKHWCDNYYADYTDFGWKLLEWTYGINTPDPVYKDGKLVFGDEFSKTPEEFVYDIATLVPPID